MFLFKLEKLAVFLLEFAQTISESWENFTSFNCVPSSKTTSVKVKLAMSFSSVSFKRRRKLLNVDEFLFDCAQVAII